MESKKVTVIIPTYGRASRIEECIESLIHQTYKNIEIIVIDDNPINSDSRVETLKKLEKYLDKIKIILMEKNSGACAARNKGILLSTGEIITFLDDDDIYYPTKVEEQVKVLLADLTLDFVGCDMKVFVENQNRYKKDIKCNLNRFSKFAIDGVLYTPMLMIRKNRLIEVGLFSETPKFQDHLLVLKLLSKGMKYKVIEKSLFSHTIHSEDRITYSENFKIALEKLEKIENNNIEKFTKFEKNLLILKRIKLTLNGMQNLKKRDYYMEIKLICKYNIFLMKGCRVKEVKEGLKILIRIFMNPKKLEELKLKYFNKI